MKQIKNYKIKLRLMGDYKDHIDLESSRTSLKISLLEDTLNGKLLDFIFQIPVMIQMKFSHLLLKFVGFPTLFTKNGSKFFRSKISLFFKRKGQRSF